MKIFLLASLFTLPLLAQAEVITFDCVSFDAPGIHKFDAKGVVSIDADNKIEGVVSVQTEKAEANSSVQVFEEIKVDGTRRHFNAGEMTNYEFDQYALNSSDSYIKHFNLLVDYKGNIASQVMSADGFVYRSNCKVVQDNN